MSDTTTSKLILKEWNTITLSIKEQMKSRGVRASNELRNASLLVLRGQRHGRRYIVPGTGRVKYYKRTKTAKITYQHYTASAPGEAPAVRTGILRLSWQPKSYLVRTGDKYEIRSQALSTERTENGKYLLSDILEEGTSKMEPRPHQQQIIDKAMPNIMRIYQEPYV